MFPIPDVWDDMIPRWRAPHITSTSALKQQPYIFTKQPTWGAVPVASEYVVVGIPW